MADQKKGPSLMLQLSAVLKSEPRKKKSKSTSKKRKKSPWNSMLSSQNTRSIANFGHRPQKSNFNFTQTQFQTSGSLKP